MVDSLYWKSVRSSHQIYDFQDLEFVPGYWKHGDSWNLGSGPDYYSELMLKVTSTWDKQGVRVWVHFLLSETYWDIIGYLYVHWH